MKKFSFTLKALEKVKNARERQIQAELTEIRLRLSLLAQEEKGIEDRYTQTEIEYQQRLEAGVNAADIRMYAEFFSYLRDELGRIRADIEKVQGEEAACQARLVEIMRELKMLEKLKDKQYRRYLVEVQKDEDKQIDDLMTFKTRAVSDG